MELSNRRQREETDAQELPPEHEEELQSWAVTEQWNRLSREGVETPSVEKFQNCLHAVLYHVLWDDPA